MTPKSPTSSSSILYCHPALRQQLRHLLDHLDSLDALVPLSPNNPKRGELNLAHRANSLERIVAQGKDAAPSWDSAGLG